MSDDTSPSIGDWYRRGRGIGPTLKWTCNADGPLTALDLALETGEVFAADEAGTLFRLDRQGRIAALTRLRDPVRVLDWSDDGRFGVAVTGESTLHRLDHDLQSVWKVNLPEVCVSAAISPYGTHLAAGMANGRNIIYSEHKRREAEFESVRPLAHLKLAATVPLLIGAAEHNLLCCHTLAGESVWQQKLWSNAGGFSMTGDAETIYLAAYHHGVQTFDGDGENIGAYVVEGTVSRVSASFEAQRLIAATLERHLYWLDVDGQMLWAAETPEDVAAVRCDPLGEWAVCGFDSGRIARLDWAEQSKIPLEPVED
jgi:hypothetical protein